jgi:hypothetical protein
MQQSDEKLDNNPTKTWITIRPKAESLSDQGLDNSPTKSWLYQVRVGTDIGLKCLKCQRRVLPERSIFERRLKEFVPRSD